MIFVRRLALVLTVPVLSACAAIQITPGAERVRTTNQEPQGCEYLGEVVGTQGDALTGGLTSNEALVTGALNDIKNKAFALGANVVHILSNTAGHTSSQSAGGMTSSHLMGVAYRCPVPAAR